MRRAFCAAAALALPVGCMNLESPTSANPSQLVVHGVLDTHAGLQTILIYRAQTGSPGTTTGSFSDDAPVTDATVTVTAPNGTTMTATEKDSSFGYRPGAYRFWPIKFGVTLVQGATYSFHARTSLGEEVSGTTTIPQVFTGATPLPARIFFRDRDTLRLNLPRALGAPGYELLLASGSRTLYRAFTDTNVALPGMLLTFAGDMVFPPFTLVNVAVSAVDANYYEYYRSQSDPFAGAAPSHLSGAVGLFGSIVPVLMTDLDVR